jgi:hypothetical protein
MIKMAASYTGKQKELRKLAAWYRSWAEIVGNPDEKRRRLALAEYLERQARKKKDSLGGEQRTQPA